MKTQYPQTIDEWQEAIAAGLGLSSADGRVQW